VSLTLHVGIGTFQPIKSTEIADHVMHAEWVELSSSVVKELNARRTAGGRIVAVGSTCARALETASAQGALTPFVGQTRLFIQPGHVFRGLDALITNFHLPRTTLLVLVTAFAGLELTRLAYLEAIANRYRFFSYGDAMLIL
jgi:S-adenosylmethionine:tRNA ribosyltransferase-isomerase